MNDKLSKFQSSFSQLLDVEIPLRDLCYNEIYLFHLLPSRSFAFNSPFEANILEHYHLFKRVI